MRWLVCLCALTFAAGAAEAPLEVITPLVAQSDGGTPVPAGFTHVPGEALFFTCQVANYGKDAEQKVKLRYTIELLDPRGVRVLEPFTNQIQAELTPQDKEWKPKIRIELPLPPLGDSGTYRIVAKVEDEITKAKAEKVVPVDVRGHVVEPSETLIVRNFRFFRGEEDQTPLAKPVYRPGDPVWARFDITGYKFGAKNAIDVVYGVGVLTTSGKVLWSQPEAAVERSDSFYPKRYVPGAMSINLQSNFRPGEYAISVQVKDAVGGQTYEGKFAFFVE
jgi:hypothetical protein